jgi:hypothetical protein
MVVGNLFRHRRSPTCEASSTFSFFFGHRIVLLVRHSSPPKSPIRRYQGQPAFRTLSGLPTFETIVDAHPTRGEASWLFGLPLTMDRLNGLRIRIRTETKYGPHDP